MKLKLWKRYEDLPYLETDTALHVKKAGILEKLELGPTDRAWCPSETEAVSSNHLEVRAGTRFMRGIGITLAIMALIAFIFMVKVTGDAILPLLLELESEGAGEISMYFVLAFVLIGTGFVLLGVAQGFLMDARPFRDHQYRFCRKTNKLYEWWRGRVIESCFCDLVPCYQRLGIGTATTGSFLLVDLDRSRSLVRRIYYMAGDLGSGPFVSQSGWEYIRRYMAGEFDRLPVMPQAAPLQSGFTGIARDFAPARWGRTLIARLGPLGYLLAFPLIVVVGLLTGLPWLYTTLADLRLTLPDWSRIEQADSGTAASPPLEHLLERDPQFEAQQRIAAWEAPLYGVVMVCGSALWLVLISWMFNWIHSAFAR